MKDLIGFHDNLVPLSRPKATQCTPELDQKALFIRSARAIVPHMNTAANIPSKPGASLRPLAAALLLLSRL
ncbi:hypothetical protein [Maritimibacter fusiformis]|uniref:Uncharacterized protein n=1 Tax=Maritimibacter fusiformis TaxID=2603819 RepID=A0A5D0RG97_9RHOB|nr:hypothetical protein [Maritimibacter fusiformis]TYB80542.1 hypothetical protein FVF75_12945 [Maritimibacter fusiformis]